MKKITVLGAIALALFSATPAFATKTVTSPYVKEGSAAVEWKGGFESHDDAPDVWKMKTQGSYGVTSFYDVKVGGTVTHRQGDETEFTSVEIENKFQLAPKGALWIDPGIRLDYIHSTNTGVDAINGKLLLAKKFGNFASVVNFEAGHQVGENQNGKWSYNASYSGMFDVRENLQLGAEWYSEFGDFETTWDEQKHIVGPMAYGTAFGKIKYQAGVLAGVSEAAPDILVKTIIKYEF